MDNQSQQEQPPIAKEPTAQTPPAKNKLNWKGFLIALVIVGVLDYGAITVIHNENKSQNTPTPTPNANQTANWKTYTSSHFPFTFKYPDPFQASTEFHNTGNETISATVKNELPNPVKGTPHGFININLYPRNGSYEKDVMNNTADTETIKNVYKYDFKTENVTVNGIPGQKTSGYRNASKKGERIDIVLKDSKGLAIISLYSGDQNYLTDAQVNQMLSTITFTAPFPTIVPTAKALNPTPNPTEYFLQNKDQVACTDDAMQCPDGSYVGRSGPKCEFVCPK